MIPEPPVMAGSARVRWDENVDPGLWCWFMYSLNLHGDVAYPPAEAIPWASVVHRRGCDRRGDGEKAHHRWPGRLVGEGLEELIESCHAADGMLWSSPMYQGTISGALKNALDWLHLLRDRDPPFLHDKVIGLISAAGGTQGLQAINTMEFAVRALRGWAVPYVVPVAAAVRVFDADGRIREPAVALQLKTLGEEVVRVTEKFASDGSLHRQAECEQAAERVATVA
ncbi:MAG: hypothetical protein DMD76_31440 [Candidatus Rokuibacteriota bacterium]|nr:MAG: hypothetical protein DMD76_31440 [Candidatus Rokubacteria bacterium]